MKIYIAIIIICLTSCKTGKNNLNNTLPSNSTTALSLSSGTELERLYDEMTGSVSYLKFRKSTDDFLDKLNFDEDGDTSIVEDKQKLKEWITANLSKTKFTSVEDAIAHWDRNLILMRDLVKENEAYYKVWKSAPENERNKYSYIP